MKTWLQLHAAHLQSITALCTNDDTIEAVLALLAKHQSRLTSASFVVNSSRQLATLGCLRYLTACTLQLKALNNYQPAPWLDLTPLQALPSLRSLVLKNGSFFSLNAVAHLSSLSIVQCQIRMGSFVTPLEKLFISDSRIDGFGSRDLSACQSLEHLTLINSFLSPAQTDLYGDQYMDPYPEKENISHLSGLTGLKTLRLDFAGIQAKALNVDWLYHLVQLGKLKLVHKGSLVLSEGMGSLSKLMSLSIDSTQRQVPGQRCCIAPHTVFKFEWRKLGALRHVEVCGDFVVDLRLLDLITLKHLQHVNFEGHPLNRSSVSAFAICTYRLAALRSEVHVKIHGADDLLSDNMETIWDQYDASRSAKRPC